MPADPHGLSRAWKIGPRPDHTGYQVPIEAADALSLLDYLAIDRTAIIGTSRGGLIAMVLAATAPGRLIGVCLNDIGPVIEQTGLDVIANYIGQNPPFPNHQDYARVKPAVMRGFANVPPERWLAEVRNQSTETPNGLVVNYDPALRDAFMASAASAAATPNLWPLFDAMRDMPLAIIRGANSDLLSPETTAEMVARHPGAILANVPDRAHVPFLDEPEALAAIHEWIGQCRSR